MGRLVALRGAGGEGHAGAEQTAGARTLQGSKPPRQDALLVESSSKSRVKRSLPLFQFRVEEGEQGIHGIEMTLGDGHSCYLAWSGLGERSEAPMAVGRHLINNVPLLCHSTESHTQPRPVCERTPCNGTAAPDKCAALWEAACPSQAP